MPLLDLLQGENRRNKTENRCVRVHILNGGRQGKKKEEIRQKWTFMGGCSLGEHEHKSKHMKNHKREKYTDREK